MSDSEALEGLGPTTDSIYHEVPRVQLCEACVQMVREGHWDVYPDGYNQDVQKVIPPGEDEPSNICSKHRSETFNYPAGVPGGLW